MNLIACSNSRCRRFRPGNGGALTFLGFEAGAGEYFESIAFSGAGATGVTDVQVGVSSVPEASSSSLMLLGLAGIGAMLRSRRQRNAA